MKAFERELLSRLTRIEQALGLDEPRDHEWAEVPTVPRYLSMTVCKHCGCSTNEEIASFSCSYNKSDPVILKRRK
jgi:hypothetical protein